MALLCFICCDYIMSSYLSMWFIYLCHRDCIETSYMVQSLCPYSLGSFQRHVMKLYDCTNACMSASPCYGEFLEYLLIVLCNWAGSVLFLQKNIMEAHNHMATFVPDTFFQYPSIATLQLTVLYIKCHQTGKKHYKIDLHNPQIDQYVINTHQEFIFPTPITQEIWLWSYNKLYSIIFLLQRDHASLPVDCFTVSLHSLNGRKFACG